MVIVLLFALKLLFSDVHFSMIVYLDVYFREWPVLIRALFFKKKYLIMTLLIFFYTCVFVLLPSCRGSIWTLPTFVFIMCFSCSVCPAVGYLAPYFSRVLQSMYENYYTSGIVLFLLLLLPFCRMCSYPLRQHSAALRPLVNLFLRFFTIILFCFRLCVLGFVNTTYNSNTPGSKLTTDCVDSFTWCKVSCHTEAYVKLLNIAIA